MTTQRVTQLEAAVARLQRNQRRLLWLLAAVGIVRLALMLEGWALGMTHAEMAQQAIDLFTSGQAAR